jgi:hypothetical protein
LTPVIPQGGCDIEPHDVVLWIKKEDVASVVIGCEASEEEDRVVALAKKFDVC